MFSQLYAASTSAGRQPASAVTASASGKLKDFGGFWQAVQQDEEKCQVN